MAGTRSPRARLMDMPDAISGIRLAVETLDFPAFERSWIVRRAVERGLEIISEASRPSAGSLATGCPHRQHPAA